LGDLGGNLDKLLAETVEALGSTFRLQDRLETERRREVQSFCAVITRLASLTSLSLLRLRGERTILSVVEACTGLPALQHLNLCHIMGQLSAREKDFVCQEMAGMLVHRRCALKSLHLGECRLGASVLPIFGALRSARRRPPLRSLVMYDNGVPAAVCAHILEAVRDSKLFHLDFGTTNNPELQAAQRLVEQRGRSLQRWDAYCRSDGDGEDEGGNSDDDSDDDDDSWSIQYGRTLYQGTHVLWM